jgi:uncharacterized protein YcfL
MNSKMLVQCLAASLLAAGCASEHGAYLPENADKYNQESNARLVLMDPGARKSVSVSSFQERTLDDGRFEAAAVLRNRENRRIQVQVQCVFKDAYTASTGDETPWQDIVLTENGQETLRFTSMNNQARAYTIRVREAR